MRLPSVAGHPFLGLYPLVGGTKYLEFVRNHFSGSKRLKSVVWLRTCGYHQCRR